MNFLVRYSPVFVVSAAVVLIQPQAILALSAEQVNNIAKKVSVRIDGKNTGSGVIIAREGDTYIAITNWHVVNKSGQYQIQTYDGQSHSISYDRVRKLTGADLAVVYFTSGKEYPIAARGNSDRLIEGQRIYYAGYPGSMRVGSRTYRFYSENIIGFLLDSDIQDGYELIYSGEAIPGMSGSPILDEQGRLIAIYGRADIDNITSSPSLYGIPINTAEKLAIKAGIKFNTSVATSSPPSRATTTPKPNPAEQQPRPDAIAKIDGLWRDLNYPNNLAEIAQDGKNFRFTRWGVLPNGIRYQSSGRGTITGQRFTSNYRATYQFGDTSTGNCSGTVSPDGMRMEMNCSDSTLGSFTVTGIRR